MTQPFDLDVLAEHIMEEREFLAGSDVFVADDSPGGHRSAIFEDDGETGYFYAVRLPHTDDGILDAVHIDNVANVTDKDRPSKLFIVWSEDGTKCALLINGYPHAAFDFVEKRGYCRTNFPNFPDGEDGRWLKSDHQWSDTAVAWLELT